MTTRDGLFQRPDSKNWWVSYVVGKKTVRESAKTSKKGEAKEFRQRRLSEYYNKGVLGRDLDKVMVRSLWEAAERDFKQDALRSLPDLQTRWHLHLDRFFNCYKAVDVTTDAISKYIEGRQNEDASNATINRELSLLGQIFRKAVASEPPKVMRVPKIKKLDEGAPRMGFLNEIQAEKLLAFAREQAPWFRLFLKMALCYGWRKDSELLSLRSCPPRASTLPLC